MALIQILENLNGYYGLGPTDLNEVEFSEKGSALRYLLERYYRAGVDGFESIFVENAQIKGVFYDYIDNDKKRYAFTVDVNQVSYKYIEGTANFSIQNYLEFAKKNKAKKRNCKNSTECGRSCIKKGLTCRKSPSPSEKRIINRLIDSSENRVVLKSGVADVPTSELNLDPTRFQYKLLHNKAGSSGSLSGVRKWDAELAGIIQVWQDPEDGRTYVVNGHNRANLAKEQNVEDVTVRYIKAQSAAEARATGALTNIAEGRGNALDAAKFFRDSGISRKELEDKGIPLREKIATDGLALSNLSPGLFSRVSSGDIAESRGIEIGKNLSDHGLQNDLVKLIESQEKKNKKITNETIKELAEMVESAPQKQESSGGLLGLLGFQPEQRSLVIEKASIQGDIKKRLSREKKLFGIVGKSASAQTLQKAGNQIEVEKSKDLSEAANRALQIFDREKRYSGDISAIINSGAERIANGENPKTVKNETYKEVFQKLQETKY